MKIIILIVIVLVSALTDRAMADDITLNQHLSIVKFAEKIKSSAEEMTESGAAEKDLLRGALDQNLLHISYVIIYITESKQSGENVQAAFTAVFEKIGELRVKKSVGFIDERTEILQKLSADAFKQFDPESSIVFSPVAAEYLARERTLGELVEMAQGRISKATGFKFKAINPVYQQ